MNRYFKFSTLASIFLPYWSKDTLHITCYVKKEVTIEEINQAFKTASENELKGILAYTEDPIVSVDIIGNQNSCLFDAQLTSVIDKMVKVVGWYDNEIGYSSRIIDLIFLLKK
jgi:glyceraldehyde 3-phosphate dehydrogenase